MEISIYFLVRLKKIYIFAGEFIISGKDFIMAQLHKSVAI